MTELGIFAKYWYPGQVKTRLAETIGEPATVRIYQAFLRCLAARWGDVADQRRFIVSPSDSRDEFTRLLSDARWELDTQAEGDLGQRMRTYFEQALHRSARVVLLGSDSPDVPRKFLERAYWLLATHDVVIGPSDDGGYYLIGAARTIPDIFAGIPWSTERVFDETRQRLMDARVPFDVLPTWHDVDTAADLARLKVQLENQCEDVPLQELLAVLREVP
jgi:hypothetical protein